MNRLTEEVIIPTDDVTKEPSSSLIGRGTYCLGAFLFYLFLFYGSLTPFEFQACQPSWVSGIETMLSNGGHVESKVDWYVNLLLGVPAGFLVLGALCLDRKAYWIIVFFFPVLLICGFFAFAVESLQLFTPNRNSALSDILAQTMGAGLGAGVWSISGQAISDEFKRLLTSVSVSDVLSILMLIYLLMLIIGFIFPLDVIYSLHDLNKRWLSGVVFWEPFGQYSGQFTLESVCKIISIGLCFVPLGALPVLWKREQNDKSRFTQLWATMSGFQGVMMWAILFSTAILTCQFFVESRKVCTSTIILAVIFAGLGWLGMKIYQSGVRIPVCLVGLFVTLFSMVCYFWFPFNFNLADTDCEFLFSPMQMIPLADYQKSNPLNSFYRLMTIGEYSIAVTFFLYGIFHALKYSSNIVLLTTASLFTLFEAGQLFLPTRTFTLSDIFVQIGISFAVLKLVQYISELIDKSVFMEIKSEKS